jgi:pimeloyl-ACP methyl ester carboxylesterase
VGLGLLPYLPLLLRLAASGAPLLALECKHLAMRATRRLPAVDDVVEDLAAICREHRLGPLAVVGHSYGTLMASRLVQLHPRLVHSLALIDPVCLMMFSGHLVRNFVYCRPTKLSAISTWLVARELHTAASVTRSFFWSLLNLCAAPARPQCCWGCCWRSWPAMHAGAPAGAALRWLPILLRLAAVRARR